MKKQSLIFIIFILGMFFVLVKNVEAACTKKTTNTWEASADYASVKSCVDQAAAEDTVNVLATAPEGVTWNNQLVITKAISIIGAGIDQTIIDQTANSDHFVPPNINENGNSANFLVSIYPANPADNPKIRISGFTFNFGTYSHGIFYGNYSLISDCTNVRLDHLKLSISHRMKEVFGDGAMYMVMFYRYGLANGVMDHCSLIGGLMDIGGSENLWTTNAWEFGTASNFYFEDNTWIPYAANQEIVNSGNGASRYAWRHNTITLPANVQENPLFDQHGNQSSCASSFGAEIYDNTFVTNSAGTTFLVFDQRGGKSVMYNNTVTFPQGTLVANRAREDHLDSDGPGLAIDAINGQPQHVSSSYYWNNLANGSKILLYVADFVNSGVPRANTDVWTDGTSDLYVQGPLDTSPQFVSESSTGNFNGTVGVGSGLKSARPSTCTTGVGYWATDENKLYRCVNNAWPTTAYYTPYQYPHPLRTDCVNYPTLCDRGCQKTSANAWTTTPDYESVKSCVDQASSGDTINVSAGSATWNSTININKAIIINGNSATITAGSVILSGLFKITGITTGIEVRIHDFIFQLNDYKYGNYCVVVTGNTFDNIRIDHNTFYFGYNPVFFNNPRGLIDHNEFHNPYSAIQYSSDGPVNANTSWLSMAAGTEKATFIEDNKFIHDENYLAGSIESGGANGSFQEQIGTAQGGKLVIRNNTFDSHAIANCNTYETWIMTHGSAPDGNEDYWEEPNNIAKRGQPVVEVYKNTFKGKSASVSGLIFRGSANLVYDNTFWFPNGDPLYTIQLYEEEYDSGIGWAIPRITWPAEDQVHNSFFWNNIMQIGTGNSVYLNSNYEKYFVIKQTNFKEGVSKDRDFFLHKPCGISASKDGTPENNDCTYGKETFVCANGVTNCNGASNAYPTDGNTYPTKGTMVFTPNIDNAYVDYQPYQYPHPLAFMDCTTKGDFTCNGFDANDIQVMINIILNIEQDSAKIEQAKMNTGDSVDATDLQLLINKVLGIN